MKPDKKKQEPEDLVKHDIYGTDRHREAPLHMAKPKEPQTGTGMERWSREMRRTRVNTILFTLTAIGLVAFIVGILVFYYIKKPHWQSETETEEEPRRIMRSPGIDLNVSPENMFITDELSSLKPEPEPEQGNMELSEKWVKQAAYHLTQAEKSARSGYLEDALDHYTQALWIYPELKGVHRHMGLIHLKLNRFQYAARAFEQAVLEDPESHGIANNLGVAYLHLKQDIDAEKLFKYALNKNPSYTPSMYNLGTMYVRRGDFENADKWLSKNIQLDPNNTKAAYTYAYTLIQMERWLPASRILANLADVNPESPPVFFRLAQTLTRIDNKEEAVKALERGSMLLDPDNALAWINKSDYDPLREHPRFLALIQNLGNQQEL